MKITNLVVMAALVIGTATVAKADQISINGNDTYNSTTIWFTNPASVGGTPTGVFSAFTSPCTGCATMVDSFNYTDGSVNPSDPITLFTIVDGTNTATFTLDSISGSSSDAYGLGIYGDGTVDVNGTTYDGNVVLTTQGPSGSEVTFSATSTVPEPESLALFGTGLLGIVGIARRRFHV